MFIKLRVCNIRNSTQTKKNTKEQYLSTKVQYPMKKKTGVPRA